MRILGRAAVFLAGFAAGTLAFGFVLFATSVTRDPVSGWDKADGIVVLTGTEDRIQAGARLLSDGRAGRLLISGVNRLVRREELQAISRLDAKTFACCVDLGYQALDTVGNADEARTWATRNGYTRLIIVTSSYHMPRSLAELSLAMPGRVLLPHPVLPRNFPDTGWWLHVATTRLLLTEYLKYLPAAARLTAQRVMGWNADPSFDIATPQQANG